MLTQTGMFLAAFLAGGGYGLGWIKGRAGGFKKALNAMGQAQPAEQQVYSQPITLVEPPRAALPRPSVVINGAQDVVRNLHRN